MACIGVKVTINTGEIKDDDFINTNDWHAGKEITHEHRCFINLPTDMPIEDIVNRMHMKYRVPYNYIWMGASVSSGGPMQSDQVDWQDGDELHIAFAHPIVRERHLKKNREKRSKSLKLLGKSESL